MEVCVGVRGNVILVGVTYSAGQFLVDVLPSDVQSCCVEA